MVSPNPGRAILVSLNISAHQCPSVVNPTAWLRLSPGGCALSVAKEFLARIDKIQVPSVGVEAAVAGGGYRWRSAADEFLGLLAEADVPILFLFDEFPTFLKLVAKNRSREEVEAVLNWFRAARHELMGRGIRFLVTGSIGLKGVVRSLGLAPTVNEFDTHEIPPLTGAEAQGLLEKLAADNAIPLDAGGRKEILRLLGANWPILLQLFLSEIQEGEFNAPPTPDELGQIYRERLVHGGRNKYCDGMFDRLKDIFTESERRLAREILKAVCRSADGLARADFDAIHLRLEPVLGSQASGVEELDHVLDTLKHDGYLLQEAGGSGRTRFGSNILGDYWRRRTS